MVSCGEDQRGSVPCACLRSLPVPEALPNALETGVIVVRTGAGPDEPVLKRKPQQLGIDPASGLVPVDIHTLDAKESDLPTESSGVAP